MLRARTVGPIAIAFHLATAAPAFAQTRVIDADALPRLALVREQRIGHADDPKLSFNRIRYVEVDREGRVYVFDSQTSNIRVFARDGSLVRTIGSRGSGPGEFSARFGPSALGLIGDSLWSFETLGRRVNVFARDGRVISATALASLDVVVPVHRGGVGMLSPGFMQRDGTFISDFTTIAPNGDFEVRALRGRGLVNRVAATDTVRVPIVRFHADGSRVDTIGALPLPPPDDRPAPTPARGASGRGPPGTVQVGGISYSVPTVPWTRYLSLARADGSVIVTRVPATADRAATFAFTRFDLAGKVAQHIRFTYKPRRYDSRVLDSLAMREVTQRGDANPAAFRALRAAMSFPDFQAPVYTAWPASDGAIWLRREWDASANHRWIVVDRRGGVRGIVLLPSGARPLWADANTLVAEEPDDTGVPWLVRYRLGRGT